MRRSAMRRTGLAGVVAAMVVGLLLTVTGPASALTDEEWAEYEALVCEAFGWCEPDGLYPPLTEDGQLPVDGIGGAVGGDPGAPAEAAERSGLDVPEPRIDGPAAPITDAPAAPATDAPAEQATGVSSAAIQFALGQVGKPYVWGGAGPNGFDCSGLTLRAFGSANIVLPRIARDQYNAGQHVPVTQAQPGDLLFWASDRSKPATIYHVALYIGGGRLVEASQQGVPVRVRQVDFNERQLVQTATRPGS